MVDLVGVAAVKTLNSKKITFGDHFARKMAYFGTLILNELQWKMSGLQHYQKFGARSLVDFQPAVQMSCKLHCGILKFRGFTTLDMFNFDKTLWG